MEKRNKIIYYVSTGLLTAMMLMTAIMYFLKHGDVSATWATLGFPAFVIYPLAIAKLLGLLAIWTKKSNMLKEWAYAGFFFLFLLAFGGHMNAGDGQWMMPLISMLLLAISYWYDRKVFAE